MQAVPKSCGELTTAGECKKLVNQCVWNAKPIWTAEPKECSQPTEETGDCTDAFCTSCSLNDDDKCNNAQFCTFKENDFTEGNTGTFATNIKSFSKQQCLDDGTTNCNSKSGYHYKCTPKEKYYYHYVPNDSTMERNIQRMIDYNKNIIKDSKEVTVTATFDDKTYPSPVLETGEKFLIPPEEELTLEVGSATITQTEYEKVTEKSTNADCEGDNSEEAHKLCGAATNKWIKLDCTNKNVYIETTYVTDEASLGYINDHINPELTAACEVPESLTPTDLAKIKSSGVTPDLFVVPKRKITETENDSIADYLKKFNTIALCESDATGKYPSCNKIQSWKKIIYKVTAEEKNGYFAEDLSPKKDAIMKYLPKIYMVAAPLDFTCKADSAKLAFNTLTTAEANAADFLVKIGTNPIKINECTKKENASKCFFIKTCPTGKLTNDPTKVYGDYCEITPFDGICSKNPSKISKNCYLIKNSKDCKKYLNCYWRNKKCWEGILKVEHYCSLQVPKKSDLNLSLRQLIKKYGPVQNGGKGKKGCTKGQSTERAVA